MTGAFEKKARRTVTDCRHLLFLALRYTRLGLGTAFNMFAMFNLLLEP
jgi:hypothetical protein